MNATKTARIPSLSAAARNAGATKIVRCMGKGIFSVGFRPERASEVHQAIVTQFGSSAVTWDGSASGAMIVRI